jgi:multiple sugar transport system permease protein
VVALDFLIGFGIAFLLNRKIKGKGVFYTILTIQMVMAPVSVALIWRVFLHPELGIVNYFLSFVRIPPAGSSCPIRYSVLKMKNGNIGSCLTVPMY